MPFHICFDLVENLLQVFWPRRIGFRGGIIAQLETGSHTQLVLPQLTTANNDAHQNEYLQRNNSDKTAQRHNHPTSYPHSLRSLLLLIILLIVSDTNEFK